MMAICEVNELAGDGGFIVTLQDEENKEYTVKITHEQVLTALDRDQMLMDDIYCKARHQGPITQNGMEL